MFTGIIRSIGKVLEIKKNSLWVGTRLKKAGKGDSVAIEGICLTALAVKKTKQGLNLRFEASQETLEKTALQFLKDGTEVNVEPALRAGDPIGGHFVQGHVDGVGKIEGIEVMGNSKQYRFSYPRDLDPYLVFKGSIAVNGVSLTIAKIDKGSFSASILPFTEEETSFRSRRIGDPVNLEADVLAKVAAKRKEDLS